MRTKIAAIKIEPMLIPSKKPVLQIIALAAYFLFMLPNGLSAQDGEAIFKQNCAACHKVGGGRMVGPDLMGVTTKRSEEWLIKWTKSSQSLIKSGDADAKAIFEEFNQTPMPDQAHLSDADLKALYAYVASKSEPATAATAGTNEPAIATDASKNATAEDIEYGKGLFIGSQALVNGGPACISCHNVNYADVIPGGLLAKDLTNAFSRLGGDAGIHGMLGAPPFPAMTEAYKNKAITDKEIAAITAFLYKVDSDKANQQVASFNYLLYGGFGGAVMLLALIFLIWNNRKKYTVKKSIYDRQIKSI